MQDKELENLLQKKADEIELRDFSEVWEEIKGEIQPPVKEKKFRWNKWLPMILASAVAVVCIALTPVIINLTIPREEVFYSDEWDKQDVIKEEMFSGLSQAQILHVNLANYYVEGCQLLVTETNQVKGASFAFNDGATFFAEASIYDKSVDLNLDFSTYESTWEGNDDVHYKFIQESDGFYEYGVYAIYNNTQYVIEYTGVSNDLTEFLNEFFA